eukprot:SAG22_NODE_8767_length_631_cov_1.152256_1_plen_48_part_00
MFLFSKTRYEAAVGEPPDRRWGVERLAKEVDKAEARRPQNFGKTLKF